MNITVDGIERIKQKISGFANLQDQCFQLAKRLCEVGEPIIKAAHGGHATITTEQTTHGYAISAQGETVLIVEFGAGDAAGIMSAYYEQVPESVRPGSWSEEHARMYSRYGFWVFAGQILHEVEPNPSFYYAYQAMIEALPKIAQEVFAK